MNLFEIVNMLELESSISEEQQLEAAEMLRRQHKAIKVLREACQQVFDQWGPLSSHKEMHESTRRHGGNMKQDKLIALAKQAGAAKYVNRHMPDAAAFGFMQEQLQLFAELVRADALDEAVNVALSHYDGYQISEDIRSLK